MSIDQLAALNRADRARVLDAAIATTRRGIADRTKAHAHSVDALRRNLARLQAERAALGVAA